MALTLAPLVGTPVVKLTEVELVNLLRNRPPFLRQDLAKVDLASVYQGWFHSKANATIIGSTPAKLLGVSPISKKKCIVEHSGFAVDVPDVGLEIANVAVYGDLFAAPAVIVRTESACPPSFLFGSQRCNCWDQWAVARELAATFHEVELRDFDGGGDLEQYILAYQPPTHMPAVVLIHLDSQSGMGSGVLPTGSNQNVGETAFMRHRGEYAAEQIHGVSMAGAFEAIGIDPDPRAIRGGAGYRLPGLILDCMGVRKDIHLLTNNTNKEAALASMGYSITRHEILGRYDTACETETRDRIKEFGHKIASLIQVDSKMEAKRLISELTAAGGE